MKALKIFTVIVIAMNTICLFSQVTIQASIDPKITLFGDEAHNVESGLSNVLLKSRWQGNQKKIGKMHIGPSFEYAQLSKELPEYFRYSVEIGYTFNTLVKIIEFGLYADYGIIKRGAASQSYGFGFVTGVKITDWIKGIATLQLVDRTDFKHLYGIDSQLKYSGFIGLEINLNK